MVTTSVLARGFEDYFAESLTRCSPGSRLTISSLSFNMRLHRDGDFRVYRPIRAMIALDVC